MEALTFYLLMENGRCGGSWVSGIVLLVLIIYVLVHLVKIAISYIGVFRDEIKESRRAISRHKRCLENFKRYANNCKKIHMPGIAEMFIEEKAGEYIEDIERSDCYGFFRRKYKQKLLTELHNIKAKALQDIKDGKKVK